MNLIQEVLLVGCGGMLGAITRHGIGVLAIRIFDSNLPWGTFFANVLGCFLIGLLIGSGTAESNSKAKLLLGVGFLGSLTTFSTLGAETVHHASNGQWPISLGNVSANFLVGFLAVVIGIAMGKRLFVAQ